MSTEIITQNESPMATVDAGGSLSFMTDKAAFEHLWRVATAYSRSKMVPDHFQNKVDDCFIVCQLSIRLGCDPFMLMQGMYVVHGRPGMEAKLQIALANARGPFKGPIQYKMAGSGKTRSCTAFAVHKETGETVEMEVTMAMAEAEGWTKAKGTQVSKWITLPELMLRYRAASFLIRLFCPDVVMGIQSKEELDDVHGNYIDAAPQRMTASDLLDGITPEDKHQEQTEPDPERTKTLESFPSPNNPNPPASPVNPPQQPTNPDEDADIAEFIDWLQTAKIQQEITSAVNAINPQRMSAAGIEKMKAAARKRAEELRPKRGERADMFPK